MPLLRDILLGAGLTFVVCFGWICLLDYLQKSLEKDVRKGLGEDETNKP